MTDMQQLGPAGRITLWILGTALFLDIAFLPYYMYMQYAADATVRNTVIGVTAVLFLLLWLATTFGPLKTKHT